MTTTNVTRKQHVERVLGIRRRRAFVLRAIEDAKAAAVFALLVVLTVAVVVAYGPGH